MTLLSASSGAVGVSADGGMLAIAHDKGQIIRQSAIGATRKPIGRLDGIEHVATSDEGVVAVSSGDHLIRLPRTERDMETTLPVRNGLAMAPDGRYVAAATGRYVSGSGHRGVVEAYGIEPATKRIFEMEGTVLGMWQLHIVNGRLATTTQTDAKSGLIVWDLATGRPIFQRRGFESYWVRALSFDASGNRMLSGDERGWLRLWDVDADRLLLERREPMPVQSTAISEDRSLVAWGLWNATVKVARVTSASK